MYKTILFPEGISIIKYISLPKTIMIEDITCIFDGVGSIGAIYLSNLKAAQNATLLNNLGIKAIVTAVRGGIVKHDKTDVSDHLYVPADDIESYDLSKHFQETFNFIDNARRKTNVLVHCYAGISRSATIVVAYLMRKYGYSLQRVLSMVKRKRNKVNPNRGFVEQLKKQAERIGIVSNENQQPIEEVLRKNYSSQKKRPSSVKRIRNEKVGSQIINKIELNSGSSPIKQMINLTQQFKAITSEKLAMKKEESLQLQSFFHLEKVEVVEQDKKLQNGMAKGEQKSTKYSQSEQKVVQIGSPQLYKTSSHISDKTQKIQELKSKILESHSRKKLTAGHKYSFSQRKNAKLDNIKKQTIYRPQNYQNLSSMLSAKLNKPDCYMNQKLYHTIKNTFSPDKFTPQRRQIQIVQP